MDIHPLVVHFPIALLTLYPLFEIIRFKRVMEKPYWFTLKAIFVILGEFGASAAYFTGRQIQGRELVAMHALFAKNTVLIFGIIALAYFLEWFWPTKVSALILKPYIIIPLALIGFVVLAITGGLGGAIVYGTHFDPFMAPVFKILGVY